MIVSKQGLVPIVTVRSTRETRAEDGRSALVLWDVVVGLQHLGGDIHRAGAEVAQSALGVVEGLADFLRRSLLRLRKLLEKSRSNVERHAQPLVLVSLMLARRLHTRGTLGPSLAEATPRASTWLAATGLGPQARAGYEGASTSSASLGDEFASPTSPPSRSILKSQNDAKMEEPAPDLRLL
ncbi:hypothetical protein GCM10011376_05860 [Nocardioides flavus (ex Wang et al. 2016)]|uniref:Uncharacterized protein n=1 Tax=Nocardioides flavus (ex Wang et al. 2016) TaxID=2058780 RepID=A0ABQ3HGX6_9ACTN|nr:hypothetical protein GCM10011376_05860 [Nocardioides flavus (ex Wang et al. 2016)]